MAKPKINYVIDLLALISFILSGLSGLAIFFFMPRGVRRGSFQEFLGMDKDFWSDIHEYAGMIFFILVVVHFILHRDWFLCMTKNFLRGNDCSVESEEKIKK